MVLNVPLSPVCSWYKCLLKCLLEPALQSTRDKLVISGSQLQPQVGPHLLHLSLLPPAPPLPTCSSTCPDHLSLDSLASPQKHGEPSWSLPPHKINILICVPAPLLYTLCRKHPACTYAGHLSPTTPQPTHTIMTKVT